MNKKFKLVVLIMFLVVIFLPKGILAYFMDGDTFSANIKIGNVNTEIIEEFSQPDELKAGDSFTKTVKIKNSGPNDCFIRVRALFSDSDMGDCCTVDWNASEDAEDASVDYWYNSEDGYYYYKKVLKAGEFTSDLFTTVTLDVNISADEIKGFDILVYSEAYQANSFSGYREAWAHCTKNKPN